MIATGGKGKEREKDDLKICLAGELNPGLLHNTLPADLFGVIGHFT